MKRALISLILIVCVSIAYAQLASDALRYSNVYYTGNARFTAMGGAFGAVGANLSGLSTNPAGMGFFKKSMIEISPSLYSAGSRSDYLGESYRDSRTSVNFGNVGGVFFFNQPEYSSWKGFQLGIALNRLNNFNNRAFISGNNSRSSYLWGAVNQMNSYSDPETQMSETEMLLWNAYLIDQYVSPDGESEFYSDISSQYFANGNTLNQSKSIFSEGGVNELDISGSMNFNDKFYAGLTLGVSFLNYAEDSYYTESASANASEFFDKFILRQRFSSSGVGVNLKAGVIWRATDFFRLGFAFHSPTWYPNIYEKYFSSVESFFRRPVTDKGDKYFYVESPYGTYNWKLNTPWRVSGSVAFVIGQYGLISGDYEYASYSSMRMGPDYSFKNQNEIIKDNYGSQHIVRIGTEWNLGPIQLRAGYGYYSKPYRTSVNDGARMNISGGLGFKSKYFYADLGYMWTTMMTDYYLYGTSYAWDSGLEVPAEFSKLKYYNNIVTLTLGFRI